MSIHSPRFFVLNLASKQHTAQQQQKKKHEDGEPWQRRSSSSGGADRGRHLMPGDTSCWRAHCDVWHGTCESAEQGRGPPSRVNNPAKFVFNQHKTTTALFASVCLRISCFVCSVRFFAVYSLSYGDPHGFFAPFKTRNTALVFVELCKERAFILRQDPDNPQPLVQSNFTFEKVRSHTTSLGHLAPLQAKQAQLTDRMTDTRTLFLTPTHTPPHSFTPTFTIPHTLTHTHTHSLSLSHSHCEGLEIGETRGARRPLAMVCLVAILKDWKGPQTQLLSWSVLACLCTLHFPYLACMHVCIAIRVSVRCLILSYALPYYF